MSFAKLTSVPGLSSNYSLYAVPAGWVIAMVPLWGAIAAVKRNKPEAYNNADPQESWKHLKQAGLSPKLYGRIHRAVAANNNTHTNLPLFAAGLVAANAALVPISDIHFWAGFFLLNRAAYNVSYVYIEEEKYSWIRSGFYWAGVVSSFMLFIKAQQRWSVLPA